MQYIKHFSEINKNDVMSAGGKGASLGEMTQAGFQIPEGFVVLADAFDKFLEETDINIEIDSILKTVDHNAVHTVERASEQIQALILNADIPSDLADEIQKTYKNLAAEYVAVRSSATSEDSADAAWAGQLDTFLNTREEDLITNIQKCWASLFTPRAIFYRFEKELHDSHISVAVVIQKMIESEVSGIAFSVHPVTEDRNQLIIEAGYGLGESIVSGQITPDSYVVTKNPREILDKNIFTQEKGLFRSKDGGNNWQNIPKEKAEKSSLTDHQIQELSQIILDIENHYGFPCDIEWAIENNQIYITQSRPITTLKKIQVPEMKQASEFNPNILDYQRLFQVGSAKYILSSIFMEYYKKMNALLTYKDNLWGVYLPLKEVEKTLEEGVKLYGDKEICQKYYAEFKKYISESQEVFTEILEKKTLSLEDLNQYIKTVVKHWEYYIKTEFFYTDTAFLESAHNKIIEENFKDFESNKTQGREHLNRLIFIKDSYVNKLIHKLAIQFNIPFEDLNNYDINELQGLYQNQVIEKEELDQRKQSFISIASNGAIQNLYGDKAIELIDSFLSHSENSHTIKGQVANKGIVKATAFVLHFDIENFDSFNEIIQSMEEGQILVTETTSPELMLACKKASAIVTNQGGMMSHAAIVARELNIPCIVGTGDATSIIKTGDTIEVNADKGEIKMVEEAQS